MSARITLALCHALIDMLPLKAFAELLPTLVDMHDFYSREARAPARQLSAPKPVKLLTRSLRPDIDFSG
jgi:hypothetical protein